MNYQHIILDIGHARNTGAHGNGKEEHSESTLLCEELREQFRFEGFRVTTLDFPDLSNADDLRATICAANAQHADFGLSLHMDCSANQNARGAHVCYTSGNGLRMAKCIASRLCPLLPGRAEQTVRRPGLAVLNSTRAPWCLLEVGFISNAADAELTETRRRQIARAIVLGVVDYFNS